MSSVWGSSDTVRNAWQQATGRGSRRWRPLEIAAVVAGFAIYWPIGLAILGYKVWNREGRPDIADNARREWREARQQWKANMRGCGWRNESRGGGWGMRPTGNSAFDDWRTAELARLEEERQKLVMAEREFAEHLDNLRRARDREEFDRFMSARNAGTGNQTGGPAGGASHEPMAPRGPIL